MATLYCGETAHIAETQTKITIPCICTGIRVGVHTRVRLWQY